MACFVSFTIWRLTQEVCFSLYFLKILWRIELRGVCDGGALSGSCREGEEG